MGTPNRTRLAAILRSYAADMVVAGPQYAVMAATLKEAADELDPQTACPVPGPADCLVYDGDGVPHLGRACLNCED